MAGVGQKTPYSAQQVKRAVNLAALLGWASFTCFALVSYGLNSGSWASALGLVFWYGLIGIPIALLFCWVVIAPFLRILMRRPVNYYRAAKWGAGIGSFIVALCIATGRYRGWRQSLDPTFSSRIGGDYAVRSVDGILTPYGWWVLAQNSALFVLFCIVTALLVRWRIGAGTDEFSLETNK